MFRLVASVFESRQHAAKTWRCTEENPSIRKPDLDIPSGEEHLANDSPDHEILVSKVQDVPPVNRPNQYISGPYHDNGQEVLEVSSRQLKFYYCALLFVLLLQSGDICTLESACEKQNNLYWKSSRACAITPGRITPAQRHPSALTFVAPNHPEPGSLNV